MDEKKTFKNTDAERQTTTSEEVVRKLREMIQESELRAGDRLPPERDLAKQLGVSRPTLRAGIRTLAAVGVLKSRQGAGTFVAEAYASPEPDGNPLRILASLHGYTPDEMFEAYAALETAVVKFAAERAANEHLAAMKEELSEMSAALDNPQKFSVHDMRFQQAVAAASENRVLAAMLNMLSSLIFETGSVNARSAADFKKIYEINGEIYRAVCNRDPKAADEAVRRLLHLQKPKTINVSTESKKATKKGRKKNE
jgi:Transcriptional regulators